MRSLQPMTGRVSRWLGGELGAKVGRRALLATLATLALGCSEPSPPPVQAVTPPFPSDLFTVVDHGNVTGLRLDIGSLQTPLLEPALNLGLWKRQDLVAWLDERDGFSTFAPLYVLLDTRLGPGALPVDDAASLAKTSAVFIVNLEPGSRWGERVPAQVTAAMVEDEHLGPIQVVKLLPTAPLQAASRHGVVLLRRAGDVEGRPLPQSSFFAVFSGARELAAESPLAQHLARGRAQLLPLIDYLHHEGIRRDEVAEGFVFTTQSAPLLLTAIRLHLRGASAPPLNLRWIGAYLPADLPNRPADLGDLSSLGLVLKGEIDAPDLRGPDGAVHLPLRMDKILRVPFILALPAAPRPSLPLVMLQHGHGGRKELALYVAPTLAERGIATVAIDHMEHGELTETGLFFNIVDIPRTGGNFVQTIVNGLRLVQAMGPITTVAGNGQSFVLAKDKWIGYLGESLGSISGVGLVATEPEIRSAVFNVGAAGLATSLAGDYLDLLGENRLLLKLGFNAMLQLLLDPVDPVNHGRKLWQEKPAGAGQTQVLLQHVVGDSLGQSTVVTLADAIGVTYVCPCPAAAPMPRLQRREAPAPAPGLFYYARGKHGFLLSEPGDPVASSAVRRQAAHFFATFNATGAATIIDPLAAPNR
jgi:hypothetical protein